MNLNLQSSVVVRYEKKLFDRIKLKVLLFRLYTIPHLISSIFLSQLDSDTPSIFLEIFINFKCSPPTQMLRSCLSNNMYFSTIEFYPNPNCARNARERIRKEHRFCLPINLHQVRFRQIDLFMKKDNFTEKKKNYARKNLKLN